VGVRGEKERMAVQEEKTGATRGGYALQRRRRWRSRPFAALSPAELRDVNERLLIAGLREQELAATLEAERAQLAVILADIGDAVLVVGPTGAIVRTNPAYARLTGGADVSLLPEDAHGQPLPADVTPQARAGRSEAFRLEFTMAAADGTRRWYEAHGQPLHDHGLEVGVVVIRDITLASEQRRLQDEFLALASHELRTPLTSVKGYLDLLLQRVRGNDDERVGYYVTRARAQTQRLVTLVQDLMDVTRLQTGKLTLKVAAVDLSALVERVVETARDLPPGHAIHLIAATEPLRVAGDAGRLEQVLLNLLTNAFAYAPSEGAVEVRLRRVGGDAVLTVQDDGQGIAADQLPHLFSRYYQVARPDRPSQGGLGLGLFICQEVVAAHGGRIDVTSTEGKGTTFTVWLPLAERVATGDM
jgi:two-component system CheB/CheR fusion protein